MLAQCWLHIGVEKTGTTSIQNFLAANRARLRAEGRLYPVAPGPVSHLGLVAFALDDSRIDRVRESFGLTHRDSIAAFRERFAHALDEEIAVSGANEIILSCELLSTRLHRAAELERIRSFCDRYAQRTQVVVYLRNQVDFLVSRYTTVIQSGGRDEFRARGTAFADYAKLLDRWAAAFGHDNLVVRRFEPADFVDGDLLADFAAATGLDYPKLVPVPRHNESLDAESLVFLRAINRQTPGWLSKHLGPLRSAAVGVLQRRRGGTKFVIPRALARRIETRFRELNEKVSAEYFDGRFQPLFSSPALTGNADEIPSRSMGFRKALQLWGRLISGLIQDRFRRSRTKQ